MFLHVMKLPQMGNFQLRPQVGHLFCFVFCVALEVLLRRLYACSYQKLKVITSSQWLLKFNKRVPLMYREDLSLSVSQVIMRLWKE